MRMLLTGFLVCLAQLAHAEKIPHFLKRLVQEKGNVIVFNNYCKAIFPKPINDLPPTFQEQYQYILKTSKGLFLTSTGTGRLYRIDIEADTLSLKRLDKTYFTGYNFVSLNFTIDTTIYSFGGEGFWHGNGDLRYYVPEAAEWNIKRSVGYLHRQFYHDRPNNFYFLDTAAKALYVSGPEVVQDPIVNSRNSPFYNKLYKLDIEKAIWTEVGQMPARPQERYLANTPFGLLTEEKEIISIRENKIYKLTPELLSKFLNIPKTTDAAEYRISFFIDSTVYITDVYNWFDSIRITSKDIIDTGKKVYTPLTEKSHTIYYLLGFTCMLFAGTFWAFRHRKKARRVLQEEKINMKPEIISGKETAATFISSLPPNLLDVREKDLLSFILEQSQKGTLTSIAQINEVLGIQKRNIDIQKNVRTDVIGSINEKCKYLTQHQESILQRVRSEMDKRMFEYFVPRERFQDAENVLKQ